MDKEKLLLELYNAPSSEAVFEVLQKYDLDGPDNWKPYGDNPNNAGTFENQQSTPENALVEKLTNSVDAILMKHCILNGIDPKAKNDPSVPQDMSQAVEQFFHVKDGKWENLTESERNVIAQNIQIILTSDKKTPNVAIYDNGEGQNPANFPKTFLSIARGNKNDVPFVQGKYNFGATGAVVFCGDKHRYQMIISRRSSDLSDSDGKIGFTLVRRHILSAKEENEVKLTWYEYLVIDNEIPWIEAEFLDLGLNKSEKFISGSVVKMYSYQLTRPSMATTDLWRELNPLLFVPALPVLIYEARDYRMHSPTKLMLGNRTRLALDAREKIVFQKSLMTTLFNSQIPINVYVFSRDTSNPEFIGGKSVIYTLNGQTQGAEGKTFISQDIGYRNLREYMLISVDCSQIGTTARQELFMASRDRLKQGKYYNELKNDIVDLLKNDNDIKQLDQDYKGKAFKESGEDKELIEDLFSHLKGNQDIKKMFSGTNGAFSFFKKKVVKKDTPESETKKENKPKPKLQRYPSVFRVKGYDTDKEDYIKAIKKGGKGRIVLETDVENDFLTRSYDSGSIEITTLDYGDRTGGGQRYIVPSQDAKKLKVQMSGPYDGEIQVMLTPNEDVEVGEKIPLSIKMISSAGEKEVIVFIKIDQEAAPQKEPKPKQTEEPELSLPMLIRVVKENPQENEEVWSDVNMDADSIIKLRIGNDGAIETILINMDSNTVKKLINKKGANIERVRNKYVTSVYAHSLMVYSTLYGYYKNKDTDSKYDQETIKQIEDDLNEAVEYSFMYYANFLLTFDEFSD